jgi:hypothetical protein
MKAVYFLPDFFCSSQRVHRQRRSHEVRKRKKGWRKGTYDPRRPKHTTLGRNSRHLLELQSVGFLLRLERRSFVVRVVGRDFLLGGLTVDGCTGGVSVGEGGGERRKREGWKGGKDAQGLELSCESLETAQTEGGREEEEEEEKVSDGFKEGKGEVLGARSRSSQSTVDGEL